MIRTILVPDYSVHQILAVCGVLAGTTSMGKLYKERNTAIENKIIVGIVTWDPFTLWSQLTAHER